MTDDDHDNDHDDNHSYYFTFSKHFREIMVSMNLT